MLETLGDSVNTDFIVYWPLAGVMTLVTLKPKFNLAK